MARKKKAPPPDNGPPSNGDDSAEFDRVEFQAEPEVVARIDRAAKRLAMKRSPYIRMVCIQRMDDDGID